MGTDWLVRAPPRRDSFQPPPYKERGRGQLPSDLETLHRKPAEQLLSGARVGLAASVHPISKEFIKTSVAVLRCFWKAYSISGKPGSRIPGQMKAKPEAPPEQTGSLCTLWARLCSAGGPQKVLQSSLPMGACGQVQRRSRSEQAQHGWRRIQSIQEGPPGLEGAEWAGMQKVPGEEHRACGTSETQLQLGRGAQLGGTGEMDYMGRWESRALEQVGRLSRGPDRSDIHGQGGPEVTHETHRAGHQEGGSQGVGVNGGSRAAPGAGCSPGHGQQRGRGSVRSRHWWGCAWPGQGQEVLDLGWSEQLAEMPSHAELSWADRGVDVG